MLFIPIPISSSKNSIDEELLKDKIGLLKKHFQELHNNLENDDLYHYSIKVNKDIEIVESVIDGTYQKTTRELEKQKLKNRKDDFILAIITLVSLFLLMSLCIFLGIVLTY